MLGNSISKFVESVNLGTQMPGNLSSNFVSSEICKFQKIFLLVCSCILLVTVCCFDCCMCGRDIAALDPKIPKYYR